MMKLLVAAENAKHVRVFIPFHGNHSQIVIMIVADIVGTAQR